jgi:hypothetical protein
MCLSAWEFATERHLMKVNKVLRRIVSFPSRTQVCNLHMAFKVHMEIII